MSTFSSILARFASGSSCGGGCMRVGGGGGACDCGAVFTCVMGGAGAAICDGIGTWAGVIMGFGKFWNCPCGWLGCPGGGNPMAGAFIPGMGMRFIGGGGRGLGRIMGGGIIGGGRGLGGGGRSTGGWDGVGLVGITVGKFPTAPPKAPVSLALWMAAICSSRDRALLAEPVAWPRGLSPEVPEELSSGGGPGGVGSGASLEASISFCTARDTSSAVEAKMSGRLFARSMMLRPISSSCAMVESRSLAIIASFCSLYLGSMRLIRMCSAIWSTGIFSPVIGEMTYFTASGTPAPASARL
mmetsp:Transcript_443/g.899  ORF Transcript_443/g.899 Transcript_443/m.899 type:complete len:299 (-) Transcript_443:1449-2345(-)